MIESAFSIVAVGDLVPSRRLPGAGSGSAAFKETVGWLQGADVTFGDLEMPLATAGYPREKLIAFRGAPELVEDLSALGFDILSLANNHSMDYGPEALYETMAGLDRVKVRHLGAGRDRSASGRPVVLEVNGSKVGFLAWSCLLPTGAAASDLRPGLSPLHINSSYEVNAFTQMEEPGNPPIVRTWGDSADLQQAVDAIGTLRAEVDFLAVSVHWGFGAGEELAEYQRPMGHAFIDAGADVVLGNHVHAVHGVEIYEGKVILYSPGNFIAQQPREGASEAALAVLDDMSPDGYLARLEVEPGGDYQVELVPTSTNSDGLPEVVTGAARERISGRLRRLSQRLGTEISTAGERLLVFGSGDRAASAGSSTGRSR
jgi:poly-gamma-glutamate capsule biosynthesis protein CapA/YwtB (metallophosphatase superfamily)